ncbi:DUF3105 domain-containing protein [Actinocorallia libanotica]|uniref:DUF3105 domain-containing protein n=1 Tax=Actinocorallia libanotica TaxID=46162 RepID=A0ABN1Q7U7_9ACTN
MSPSQKATRRAREKVAAMQAAERRRNRRNKIIGAVVTGAAGVLLVGGLVFVVQNQEEEAKANAGRTTTPADGVRTFNGLSQTHVAGNVDYSQIPPVGGDHHAAWQNCGVYGSPVRDENAVHSLEHGAVWITHPEDLAEEKVNALRDLVRDKPYVLLSPHEDVRDVVMASAWGKQLAVADPADPKLLSFIGDFAQSPRVPEPGAPCTNGVGSPEA